MENACVLCFNLVMLNRPHPSLKKLMSQDGGELHKCCCRYAYLHKSKDRWEVISGGEPTSTQPHSAIHPATDHRDAVNDVHDTATEIA